jgi:hypothetical protein
MSDSKQPEQKARRGVPQWILRESFRHTQTADDPDPSVRQTPEQIEAYYLNAKTGDRAVVWYEDDGRLRLETAEIDNVNPRLGRLYIPRRPSIPGSSFYRRTGASCFRPRGRFRLVVPTDEVLGWIERNPEGSPLRHVRNLIERLEQS